MNQNLKNRIDSLSSNSGFIKVTDSPVKGLNSEQKALLNRKGNFLLNSGKTEDEAIRIAIFNVLVATTNELLKAKNSIKMAHSLMKTCLIDEKITEDGVKGE